MSALRQAAQQALEALEGGADSWQLVGPAIDALKEALVEDAMQKFTDVSQEIEAALAEPVQEPGDFDHGIGADRFKVVRGAFWWHVLIGDSPTKHGKFHSRASAEKMAADLLREFRNGAFVQHEAALAEPVQEPVGYANERDLEQMRRHGGGALLWGKDQLDDLSGYTPLYSAPPQRKP